MKQRPSTITEHRLARLIAWARLALAWLGGMWIALFDLDRRHPFHRQAHAELTRAANFVANLVVYRVYLNLGRPRAGSLKIRSNARRGFAGRTRVRSIRRAARGAWLRKLMRHRDLRTRFALIVNALNSIDALAVRAARRLKRRLTRLFALRVVRPPHQALATLARVAALRFDTS